MSLAPGLYELPPGMVAAVVTFLEMREPPSRPAPDAPQGVELRREERVSVDWYRDLFHEVGDPWLWQARLRMPDGAISALLTQPDYELWVPWRDGRPIGLGELSRAGNVGKVEYFGLVPEETGRGTGRWLMSELQERAWSHPIGKLILNTCTLDSPAAISFYEAMGFEPVRRAVELFPDPRIDAIVPQDAAPHVPLLGCAPVPNRNDKN